MRDNFEHVEFVIKRAAEDIETDYVQLFNLNQWAQNNKVRC